MGEESVLIAMPRLPGLKMVPNCDPYKCALLCGRVVYVSPGGKPLVAEGALPVCPVCAVRDAPTDAKARVSPQIRKEVEDRTGGVTPEQIMRGIKPNEAMMLLADRIITIEGQIERGEIRG